MSERVSERTNDGREWVSERGSARGIQAFFGSARKSTFIYTMWPKNQKKNCESHMIQNQATKWKEFLYLLYLFDGYYS